MKSKIVLMLVFALGACSQLLTYMPPHYRVSMDSTTELKQIGGSNINVGPFTLTAEFDNDCGITAGSVVMPDKMRVEDYIRNGLVEELKAAGMFDDTAPKITLTGTIDSGISSQGVISIPAPGTSVCSSNLRMGIRFILPISIILTLGHFLKLTVKKSQIPSCQLSKILSRRSSTLRNSSPL
jgi:hypothetical protein